MILLLQGSIQMDFVSGQLSSNLFEIIPLVINSKTSVCYTLPWMF